jgi:hypothetical protein
MQQGARLLHHLNHEALALKTCWPASVRIGQIDAVATDRIGHFQTIFLTDREVFLTRGPERVCTAPARFEVT